MDGCAGLAGGGRDARVCGEVGGVLEPADVAADGEEYLACGPGRYPRHAGRDREKRGVGERFLDLPGDVRAPVAQSSEIGDELGDEGFRRPRAGHGDGLLADGVGDRVGDRRALEPVPSRVFADTRRARPAQPVGAFVVFEQSQGGVAFDAVAGQRAFERGVQVRGQAAQPVDRPGEFVRGVLVPAGRQAERGHGLIVGFAVPERFGHARGGGRDDAGVSAVGLRAARQRLGGLAHRVPGQVCRAGAHVPGDGQRERAYRVGLVHDHEDRAPALQFDDGPAQLLFVLVDWRVEDGVAVVVEGACVMRAFAYVEAEPDIDVSGLHVGLPSVGTFRPPRPCRGTVMTPGAGIHITRRPHPRPVAVFLRMGRVPISGRGRPACGGNTLRIMNDRAIRPYHTRRPGPAARDPLTNVMGYARVQRECYGLLVFSGSSLWRNGTGARF